MALASGSLGVHIALIYKAFETMQNAILGLDPGRDKTGFAVVSLSGDLYFSGIVKNIGAQFLELLRAINIKAKDFTPWLLEHPVNVDSLALTAIALGNGTYSESLRKNLLDLRCRIVSVDEYGTTLTARELYWQLHRPSWFKRLLPRTMWIPPRPVDDLAAWAIVRRGLDMNLI